MSKVVSLFAAFICALLLANVYGEGEEYSILSPNGCYKHDSIFALDKVLKKLKDFTLPSGDAMLENWMAAHNECNKDLDAGDLKGLGKIVHNTETVLRNLLPSIPDKHVYAAIESLPILFEQKYEKSLAAGTGTLADFDTFVKEVASTLLDGMSKGTPTAATLAQLKMTK